MALPCALVGRAVCAFPFLTHALRACMEAPSLCDTDLRNLSFLAAAAFPRSLLPLNSLLFETNLMRVKRRYVRIQDWVGVKRELDEEAPASLPRKALPLARLVRCL